MLIDGMKMLWKETEDFLNVCFEILYDTNFRERIWEDTFETPNLIKRNAEADRLCELEKMMNAEYDRAIEELEKPWKKRADG
jgi:hypothetical protein